MEFIIELILQVCFEVGAEASKSNEVPKFRKTYLTKKTHKRITEITKTLRKDGTVTHMVILKKLEHGIFLNTGLLF